MNFFTNKNRTDLICEKKKIDNYSYQNKYIKINYFNNDNIFYKTILFNNLEIIKNDLKKFFKKELIDCLKKLNINNNHTFIVGLGNDNHTADSVGCKCLKYIRSNSHLENMGVTLNTSKISALEPGTLAETGIETKRIIESICKELKPDLVILIDAYVTNELKYLNKCIQITNEGITPGSGIKGYQEEISFKTINIPVLVIGIPTAVELKKSNCSYFLSTKDIDSYIDIISEIVGSTINDVLYHI